MEKVKRAASWEGNRAFENCREECNDQETHAGRRERWFTWPLTSALEREKSLPVAMVKRKVA